MLNHPTVVRFVIPILCVGAVTFGTARVSAADADARLVAAASTRKAPVTVAAKRPVAKAASAPAPAPAPDATPAARQTISEELSWAQVNAVNVNIRLGPSTKTGIVTTLKSGEYVKARALQGEWYEIQWPQSVPVWIGKESVEAGTERSGIVSAAAARVFSAGTPQSPVVAKLDKGATIKIVGEEGNWYKIQAPEAATAFIFARYVVAGVEAPSAASKNSPVAPVISATKETAAPAAPVAPAPAIAAKKTPEQSAVIAEKLSATIEDTRKQLKESDAAQAETARLAAEAKKAEAEEQAHREAEARRLADIAAIESRKKFEADEKSRRETEAKQKAEAEDRARREADAKRLEQIENARLALEAKKRQEAEEQARKETEAKHAAELEAIETKKKLETEEKARVETEAKKKAELEETARREAEAKRLEQIEASRIAAETKRKADAEEQAKKDAEAKRLEQLETARIAAETKRKAEAEEQAKRAADEKKREAEAAAAKKAEVKPLPNDDRGGLFVDPATVPAAPPAKAAPKLESIEGDSSFTPLPAPKRSSKRDEKAEPAPTSIAYKPLRIAAEDVPVNSPENNDASSMPVPPQPGSEQRVKSKFILPAKKPAKIENRAEIIDLGSGTSVQEPAPLPTTPLLRPSAQPSENAAVIAVEESPAIAAPQSIRLKPHFEARVGSANASGPVITSDGMIESVTLSPVEGANFALVREGRTIHYLMARAGVDLEKYVGRKITVTGMSVQGNSSDSSVLEVSSVTARE